MNNIFSENNIGNCIVIYITIQIKHLQIPYTYNKFKVYFTVRSISKQWAVDLRRPDEILNCRDSLVTIPYTDSSTAFFSNTPPLL